MFHSCSSLAQAPNLPAATLVNKCYQSMFYGCSSLNEVTCLATDISATDCTASWLNGVASIGTFHKASGMNNWPAGVSGIPSGWTVFEEAPADPTEPSFSYTVTDDRYWLAHFTLNSFEVNASASPVEGGTVTGEGTYNHFESCTLTAMANEGYTFVNWTENDTEVSTDATYIFTVTGPRTLVANFNPIIATQTFELVQGWNWWAPTVKVTAAQLQDSIGNSLVQIKAEEGAVGDNIEPGEMYRIQTSAPCEVSLTGLSITPVEVSLAPGANWFGSICVEEKPIAAAISVEATAGDKIVSQNGGFAIYNGTVWEGTLTTLQPSCGYVYVTTESKTLIVDAVGINEPTVTTSQVTNVTQTTATCGGNVTDDGGGEVTERGICWGTSQNPTISGSHGSSGTGTGSYTVNMTGLTANTTYYVRAYATNSAGTAYGTQRSFTTTQNITQLTVFDGTATDEGVPVVGWVLNQYTKCEYVMPASYLSSMIGKTITSMACYSNNTSVNYAATFKVFIKEVSFSTISSFQGYSGATTVYEGSLTVANGMLTIEFTTPFTYNGGNLLIGFYNISPGTTQLSNKRFYGVTATDSSVVGWNPNSLNNITSPAFPNFLPKTTFYFSN